MRLSPRWGRVNVPTELDMERELTEIPDGWVLLSYYWRSTPPATHLHVFWAGKGQHPKHTRVEWSREQLAVLDSVRKTLQGEVDVGTKVIPEGLGPRMLPEEILKSLPNGACLCVSPHGPLQMVPLHAVSTGPEEYVALRWPLCYIPTFSLLPLKRSSSRTGKVLLVGCKLDGFGNRALSDVEWELERIEKSWLDLGPGHMTRRDLSPEGTLEKADIPLQRWGQFGVLHVACHGQFPDGRPFDSALLLGSQAVRASEFFGVRVDAKLAAFSACAVGRRAESVGDRSVVGDEWLGFYLPLLYSGVGNVLASLWNANSGEAALLMDHLHRSLREGKSPVVALHQALDARIGPCPEPYWANWYVVGLPA